MRRPAGVIAVYQKTVDLTKIEELLRLIFFIDGRSNLYDRQFHKKMPQFFINLVDNSHIRTLEKGP